MYRTALYPGSFDPPTRGHEDLIKRAAQLFDRVVVAVAKNRDKTNLFTPDERVTMLKTITKGMENVEVTSFTGLTADFARKCNAGVLVRGLRVVSDFEHEMIMAMTNQKLNPKMDTIILMPSEKHLFISSRIVCDVAECGGDLDAFVCPEVAEWLRRKFPSTS